MYNQSLPMPAVDRVFKAIAHPVRRHLIELLSHSDRSVTDLTRAFDMSQPAVSQHLRELREARLVTSARVGLEHRYRLTGEPLGLVFDWSNRYRRMVDPSGHSWSFLEPPVRTDDSPKKRKALKRGR